MDNILYYPHINFPDTDWTTRTLMYYDRVGTIVPGEYGLGVRDFDPNMRKLLDANLVERVDPMQVLDSPGKVTKSFLYYVQSEDFKLKVRRGRFTEGRIGKNNKYKFIPYRSRIHSGKFDSELFWHLVEAGLAKSDGDWYTVESRTADELMTFIASVLGVKMNYLPTTDKLNNRFGAIKLRKKYYKAHARQNRKREIILQELIPFPEELDITKLRRFKDKNLDLLRQFKNRLELIAVDASIDEDSDLFRERLEELKLRKQEVAAKMNESQLGNIFVRVGGIAVALSGLSADDPLSQGLGLLGVSAAIYDAIRIENPDHVFDQSGLKYLALAERRLRKRPYSFKYFEA